MNDIEDIKNRLPIEEVIGSYIELKKSGSGFQALCPFHNEKSPSFSVAPDKGIFKCFGCGESGDIFSFVEKYESIDFPAALKKLAEQAGVELKNSGSQKSTTQRKKEQEQKNRYYHILEDITTFWQKKLLQNEAAKNYLKKRGITEKTVRKFRLGLAPDNWQDSFNYLQQRNFLPLDIETVGLIKKGEKGNYYDRFRNRIIFPIFDEQDRPVAFSGRDLSGSDQVAKYLNSPQTPLFDKSAILYGFNFAKTEARQRGYFILAEGQMDLVMSHQIGFENTVVTSGTSLTDQHLKLLKRFSENIIFAFDSDQAGLAAAFRGINKALAAGFDVKILDLDSGSDPADIILESEKKWKQIVADAQNIILFYIHKILVKNIKIKDKIKEMEEKILPLVLEVPNPIEKGNYISQISRGFEVEKKDIEAALKLVQEKIIIQEKRILERKQQQSKSSGKRLDILAKSNIITETKKKILKELTAIYYWQQELASASKWIEEAKVLELIKQSSEPEFFEKIINLNQKYRHQLVFDMEHFYADKSKENFLFNLKALQDNLKKINLKEEISQLQKKLIGASSNKKTEILKKLQKLNEQL